jgi:bifunctional DNase/RNase
VTIEMKIKGLMIDPVTQMPIIMLRDPKSEAVLPIWVGLYEANAIALQLEKITTPRPMTHDLIRDLMGKLNASVDKVVITELRENTFYASIHLNQGGSDGKGEVLIVDSRPSDAIALALRVDAPIFVDEEVITKAKSVDMTKEAGDQDRLRQWLEKLDPDELGKYEM